MKGFRIGTDDINSVLNPLQVGCWTANQRGVSAFEIEWIPDILPQMRIGELRIKFEYGHQRNGQLERRGF